MIVPGAGPFGLLEFMRHRRARLRAADVGDDQLLELEVGYLAHVQNQDSRSNNQSFSQKLIYKQ